MAESYATKVYDLWAPVLNFKKDITSIVRPLVSISWVPESHERRLKAYELLAAFYQDYSRDFRFGPDSGDTGNNNAIAESGDAGWLCDKITSRLLGDSLRLSIPGPSSLKKLTRLKSSTTPDTKKIGELEGIAATCADRQAALQDWFEDNNIETVIRENEEKCSYLGDCVYMVEWDLAEKKPNILTYDPGLVFPFYAVNGASFDAASKETVKDRIIIAWQEEVSDSDAFYIYRDVFELRKVADGKYRCWRKYATYKYSGQTESTIESMPDDQIVAGTESPWIDLKIDFIPILFVPNFKVQGEVYGQSNLARQIGTLDKTMNAYTNLAQNADVLGGATVFVGGKDAILRKDATTKEPIPLEIQPNTVYPLGEGGDATLLDTSRMQEALLKTIDQLEKRMIRNSNITEIGAGLVPAGQFPSGVALKMLLQPLVDMIMPRRAQRKRFYSTLFYYVQKMWAEFGEAEQKALFSGTLYDVILVFGEIMPADIVGMLDEDTKFQTLTDKRSTLERMKDQGFDIDVDTVLERQDKEADATAARQTDIFGTRIGADNQDQGGGQE